MEGALVKSRNMPEPILEANEVRLQGPQGFGTVTDTDLNVFSKNHMDAPSCLNLSHGWHKNQSDQYLWV